jgi:hypothetical protein
MTQELISGYDAGSVSVFLGNGDGTFQSRVDYTVGFNPFAVVTGDFNGDGILDLAVANANGTSSGCYYCGTVSILLGNGDGTFQPHMDFATGDGPVRIAVGDFNGDGKLDLAVANNTSPTVSILLGNGDGTFQTHVDYTIPCVAWGITTGDYNGDGHLDLAVATACYTTPSSFSVLLGNGDGTFQSPVNYATPMAPYSVTSADLNGDGRLDIATSNLDNSVSIFLGQGDGTFQHLADYPGGSTGFGPNVIESADLNGDGKLDLVLAWASGISIFFGNGDGTLQPRFDYNFPVTHSNLTVGDFNGDGRLDLAVGTGDVYLLLQAPVVALSNSNLSFGNQNLDSTSSPQNVTLSNEGSAPLNITSVTIGAPNSGDFAQTNNCGTTLAGGDSCTISVTFTPTATGARTASVSIADNASGSPQTVSLTGTGTVPLAGVSPLSLAFGNQNLGTTSPAQLVTLTNGGSSALSINSLAITGTNASDFGLPSNTCGSSLATSVSCTIAVTFTPTALGTRTAALTITDNASGSPQTVSLTGTGIAAATTTTITAPPITYGANGLVTVSVASSFGTVTGTVTLSVDGGAASSQNLSGGSSIFTLTGLTGGAHTLSASYAAQGDFLASSATGTLMVNKAASTTLITANTLNPSAPGQAVVVSFQVTGNGTPTGTVTVSASSGEACAGTLSGGTGSCSLTFITVGSWTLTASYSGDGNFAGSSSAGVTQTVIGPLASLSPSSVNFGNVYLGLPGVQTVTLTNIGNASMSINNISISTTGSSGGKFSELSVCPSTLRAGQSCYVVLTFIPNGKSYAQQTATLNVTDNALGSPQSVPLIAQPINPQATLSTYLLNFGAQKVGISSATKTVTLTNTGATTLTLSTLNLSGNFAFASGTTCVNGGAVAAQGSCVINVDFTPETKGINLGSLTIKDNALLSPQIVVLSGAGN